MLQELPLGPTSRFHCTRGGYIPIPGSETLPYIYKPNIAGWILVTPGSISPRTVWKPHPHPLLNDWLGLIEPARYSIFASSQRRGPDAPGEDEVPSPGQKSCTYDPDNPRTKTELPGVNTGPHGVKAPPRSTDHAHGDIVLRALPLGSTSSSCRTRGR